MRKKLAASLPKLSLDAPLIDGKTVREDPQFEYLNACIKGMYIAHSLLVLKTNLTSPSRKPPSPPHRFRARTSHPQRTRKPLRCRSSTVHCGLGLIQVAAPVSHIQHRTTLKTTRTNHLPTNSNAEYWPQPQRFWPERFLDEDSPLNDNGAAKFE